MWNMEIAATPRATYVSLRGEGVRVSQIAGTSMSTGIPVRVSKGTASLQPSNIALMAARRGPQAALLQIGSSGLPGMKLICLGTPLSWFT